MSKAIAVYTKKEYTEQEIEEAKKMLNKEEFIKFMMTSDYKVASAVMEDMEYIEGEISDATNYYSSRCANAQLHINNNLMNKTKHILHFNKLYKERTKMSFTEGYIDTGDSMACYNFLKEISYCIVDVKFCENYQQFKIRTEATI